MSRGAAGSGPGAESVRNEFFNDRTWTQSFDEIRRVVRGCSTGFVLFDSIYEQPGLVIQDQDTRVED